MYNIIMATLYIYEQIKDYLTKLIVANRNTPNYMLPSEQQVSQKFQASRVSVRKAFDLLEEEGVIYRVRGKGSFIQHGYNTSMLAAKEDPMNCYVFIVPEVSSHFVQNICNGMLAAGAELGLKILILSSANSTQLERDNIATAIRLQCAGILLMPVDENHYDDSILSLSISKFPTLFIDRRLYGLNIGCISSDHHLIGYNATEYLLNKGHGNILYFTLSRMISSVRQRLEGYEDALNKHLRGKFRRYILNVENYMDDVTTLYQDICNYLKDNPQVTGFITGCGNPALYLVKALQNLGRTIGKDCDVVFLDDDSGDISVLIDYEIPTIVQDGYEIGRTAIRSLHKSVTGNVPLSDKIIPLKNSL